MTLMDRSCPACGKTRTLYCDDCHKIREQKEKAEQFDALGGKDYVLMHKDEVKELKEKASGLYKCSQCPQWEKAERVKVLEKKDDLEKG